MKTCFIHRLGAFGDVLHASHLPRLIKEYYKVDRLDFETSTRGHIVLQGNPYIDNLIVSAIREDNSDILLTKWAYFKDEHDLFFNLVFTIEQEYCCNDTDQKYYRTDKYRRERCGKMSFYDVMTEACGIPESYYGTRGELYYTAEEHAIAKSSIEKLKKKYNADWIILLCFSGSSLHKKFVDAEVISRMILEKYPNSCIILTGSKDELCNVFEHPRVESKIGKWNLRTVALMVKYFDFYIGPETGLTCVAHLWDIPALQLLTAANWDNHIKGAKNAYWVQSDAPCSPCHKNAQRYYGCSIKNDMPLCVSSFDKNKIMAKVEEAYVIHTKVSEDSGMVPSEMPILQRE